MQDYNNKNIKIIYYEMTNEQMNNPQYKNHLIKSCKSEYIVFINSRYTNGEEIEQVIAENEFLMNYDMVIFGENILQGDIHFNMLINCLNVKPYAVIIKRSVLSITGCFNEQLECKDIYELALRVAYEHYEDTLCDVYGVECQEDIKQEAADFTQEEAGQEVIDLSGNNTRPDVADRSLKYVNPEVSDGGLSSIKYQISHNSECKLSDTEKNNKIVLTYAYVIRKYMQPLKKSGLLEKVLNNMTEYAIKAGCADIFNSYVMDFLNNSELYQRIETDTAPFYIIMGDDICYGVLKRFAICLTEQLINNGRAVITSDGLYGKNSELQEIEKQALKGIIGFQAPVLFKEYFKNIACPKYVYWFDHPVYFKDMLERTDDNYYLLCQDEYYAEFMRKYYHIHNAIQFPPAGEDAGFISNKDREYDVVFIGSYHVLGDWVIQDEFQQEYYDYMICNPEYTFEQGLENILEARNIIVEKDKFVDILCSLQNVCRKIVYDYRIKVIEVIIKSGIKIDVFGDTWKEYKGIYKDNLIIHNAVSVKEALNVWGHSKIGLNIMTWHKAGMTERVANICLSGAVCLTDSSKYLQRNFSNNENIIMYDLSRLEELPEIINNVLSNARYRENIADNAYMLAKDKHTWEARGNEFMELVG